MDAEKLGPAEVIIQSLLAHTDHLYHGRPGVVIQDARAKIGVRWEPVTHKKEEDGTRTILKLIKNGKKQNRVEIGTINENKLVVWRYV